MDTSTNQNISGATESPSDPPAAPPVAVPLVAPPPPVPHLRKRGRTWKEVREWATLGIAVIGGIFGVLGYVASKRTDAIAARVAVRQNLTSALDRLGGNEGTTRVPSGGIRPSEADIGVALAKIDEALQYEPFNAEAHWMKGICFEFAGREEDAVAEYRSATALDSKFWRAYNSLGVLYYESGKTVEAREQFSKAIDINGRSGVLHYNLGVTYARLGNLATARAEFDAAVAAAPYFVEAWSALASVLAQQGHRDQAAAVRERITALPLRRSTRTEQSEPRADDSGPMAPYHSGTTSTSGS